MFTKPELALAVANKLITKVAGLIDQQRAEENFSQNYRNAILDDITLCFEKLLEAGALDGGVTCTDITEERRVQITFPELTAYTFYQKGRVYFHCDEHKRSMRFFETAVTICPDLPPPWFFKALAHSTLDEKDEAIKSVSRAIELDETNDLYRRFLDHLRS